MEARQEETNKQQAQWPGQAAFEIRYLTEARGPDMQPTQKERLGYRLPGLLQPLMAMSSGEVRSGAAEPSWEGGIVGQRLTPDATVKVRLPD